MSKFIKVRSRNHTANALKEIIQPANKTVVLRLGSTTPLNKIIRNTNTEVVEINTPEACLISGDKLLMKEVFDSNNIITAEWVVGDNYNQIEKFPVIVKHRKSSKGKGIYYFETKEELTNFFISTNRIKNNYIIERYYNYVKEYRLHVTKNGCFYTCRKMLKENAEERWHRHDSNSVWILEENPLFDKPTNWDQIIEECIKAMNACGLDICAIDIKVQSNNFNTPKFIILETNSAPSLGEITTIKYKEIIPTLI